MFDESTLLGSVQSATGSTVSVALSDETVAGLVFVHGEAYRVGQVGSFVRIPLGYVDLFGVVSQVGAGAVPESVAESQPYGARWMTVELIGEGHRHGVFTRGLSQFPTIGDRVHIVTEDDLLRVYGRHNTPNYVQVGCLASSESIPALIDVNRLITRHSAVVGATGSGKSTTVAGILCALSNQAAYPSARILILDIHGEYGSALREEASSFRVNPDLLRGEKALQIPYWAMSFDELVGLFFGSVDDPSRGVLSEKITELKIEWFRRNAVAGMGERDITADTPIPFSIHKLWLDLHTLVYATHTAQPTGQSSATVAFAVDEQGNFVDQGDALEVRPPKFKVQSQAAGAEKIYISNSNLNIRRQIDRLGSLLRDPRFEFLTRPGAWLPNTNGDTASDLDDWLKSWIGGDKNVTVLDLSGVPSSILADLVGTLLRVLYDAVFWARHLSEGGRERPLLIVMEEAHTYLSNSENSLASVAVRKIVKEGRKYGVGAMVVSQRPSEIDPTILSQCGTIFALRLQNKSDRAHVTGAAPDNMEGLFSMLSVLRTGEAIILGEAVQLPIRAQITPPRSGNRPDSRDPVGI